MKKIILILAVIILLLTSCGGNIKYVTVTKVDSKIYSETEVHARYEVKLTKYCKVLKIEALTMLDMVWKDILPAVSAYSKSLADAAISKKALSKDFDCSFETELAEGICSLMASALEKTKQLEALINKAEAMIESLAIAVCYKDEVVPAMEALRADVDTLETMTATGYWPYPSYGDILFSVK